MVSKTRVASEIELSREVYSPGITKSILIRNLGHGLKLLQIGPERIDKYIDLFLAAYSRKYNFDIENGRTDTQIREKYRQLHPHSVFIGVTKGNDLVTTSVAVLAYDRGKEPSIPLDLEGIFDLAKFAQEHSAPQVWFITRFAMAKGLNRLEAKCVSENVTPVLAEITDRTPNNQLIGFVDDRFIRYWRLANLRWRNLGKLALPFNKEVKFNRVHVPARELRI